MVLLSHGRGTGILRVEGVGGAFLEVMVELSRGPSSPRRGVVSQLPWGSGGRKRGPRLWLPQSPRHLEEKGAFHSRSPE